MDSSKKRVGKPAKSIPPGRDVAAENAAVRAHLLTLPAGPRSASELNKASGVPQPALSYMINGKRLLDADQLDQLYPVLAPNWPDCPRPQ